MCFWGVLFLKLIEWVASNFSVMRETRFQSRTVSAAGQTDHQRDGTVREAKRGPFGVLVSGHVLCQLLAKCDPFVSLAELPQMFCACLLRQTFLSRQAYVCPDRRRVSSRQTRVCRDKSKLVTFVATKFCLSLEIFVARVCRDKNYT